MEIKKYSILTFIMNDYDIVREPIVLSDNAEYILVTDNPQLKSDKWTIKFIPEWLKEADGFTKSFYVRYHPFEFVNTDTCIVLDGSLQIKKSLDKLIYDFEQSNKDICLSIHWNQINAWNEYPYWLNYRNYQKIQEQKSKAFLKALKYDKKYKGCFEATFKIQKNNEINNELNDFVWASLVKIGDNLQVERVDQSILSAIINTEFTNLNVFPITRSLYQSDYIMCYKHHTLKPLKVNIKTKKFYLFNKEIKIYKI